MCKQTLERFTMDLVEFLNKRTNGYEILVKDVIKNNDTKLTALCLVKPGVNFSKTLYVNEFYKDYESGQTLEKIAEKIIAIATDTAIEINENCIDVISNLSDLESIKDRLFVKLVNYENNQLYLQDKVYKKHLDLAICLYIMIDIKDEGFTSLAVPLLAANKWNIPLNDLIAHALKNTQVKMPAVIKPMIDIVSEMLFGDDEIHNDNGFEQNMNPPVPENDLFVLTNESRINGAATLLYDNVLNDFASKLDVEEIYIIPSSIHELILVPITDSCTMTSDSINQMICEVNQEQVAPDEVLNNHGYIYNRTNNSVYYL